MTAYIVEVEYHDLDQDRTTELHGPFRTRAAADTFRDRLARAIGRMEQQPWGGWTASDGNDRFLGVTTLALARPVVRVRAAEARVYLTENQEYEA